MSELIFVTIPIVFVVLGYAVGTYQERRHLAALDRRESELREMLVTTVRTIPDPDGVRHAELVLGEAVIACDYFKAIASQLRNIVGGEVKSLETMVSRARRESMLRMMEQARRLGAAEVYNVRMESSDIASFGGGSKMIAAEALAFGTAVVR